MDRGATNGGLAKRQGISLRPEDRAIAEALAERYHGGNMSRLLRALLREAWARESRREQRRPKAA